MNYYPFHIGDYATHTAHLEPLEDIAYRRMLDQAYLREGPLPADVGEVARLIRMRQHPVEVEAVLNEFFELTDAGWINRRVEAELISMREKSEAASVKEQHERERQQRHRERRAAMFAALREREVFPPWDITMTELQRWYSRYCDGPETDLQRTPNGSGDVTATAIPIPTPTPTPEEIEKTGAAAPSAGPTGGKAKPAKRKEPVSKPDDVDERVWADFQVIRKAKGAPLTDTALRLIRTEAVKAGITLQAALETCCARGWQGFRADWIRTPATATRRVTEESFRERDERRAREKWAAITGRAVDQPDVIDVTPEAPVLEVSHDAAHRLG